VFDVFTCWQYTCDRVTLPVGTLVHPHRDIIPTLYDFHILLPQTSADKHLVRRVCRYTVKVSAQNNARTSGMVLFEFFQSLQTTHCLYIGRQHNTCYSKHRYYKENTLYMYNDYNIEKQTLLYWDLSYMARYLNIEKLSMTGIDTSSFSVDIHIEVLSIFLVGMMNSTLSSMVHSCPATLYI
jgi:hypothetical protein